MELHYFLTTNGSQGHCSFLEKEMEPLCNTVRLNGYPRSVSATLIRECYAIAKQSRMNMHMIHNCLDNSVEGIVFPDLKSALINVPVYAQRFDVASLFKDDELKKYEHHISEAFKHFKNGKEIHDEWEKLYIGALDFQKLDTFTENFITELLHQKKTNHPGSVKDRFFGSATINGSCDYVDVLTENTKRYLIKGRPGTGKSTFMKKLAQAAFDRGFHIERYHCSFDPNSLDMIVIRELSLSVFDATAPHEYYPSKADDEILDLYTLSAFRDVDSDFSHELADYSKRYKDAINSAIQSIINANSACIRAEDLYRKQIDDNRLMDVRKMIIEKIFP
ncbi:MAG: hypothetical protein E7403_02110 [Ruminococcaceae bacterium]|nr:hypothetical protein [Oscillospiraceae bacterium]